MDVTLVLLALDVTVTLAWPAPFVVADPEERLPAVALKLTVLPLAALPPTVKVAVILLVVAPSAAIEVGEAEILRTTARYVIADVSAEKPL